MNMCNPAHPGELVRETLDGIKEETGNKLTVEQVVVGLGTTRKTLSAIIYGKQGVSPEMALRFAKAFNTTPEFWLHAQENYDLAQARKKVSGSSGSIKNITNIFVLPSITVPYPKEKKDQIKFPPPSK